MPGIFDPGIFDSGIFDNDAGITLPQLDAGSSLYAPTLALSLQVVALPQLDAGPAIYAPEVTGLVLVIPLLDAGSALYTPTLVAKRTLTVALLTSVSALYSPTIANKTKVVTLGLLGAGPTLFSPVMFGGSFLITLTVPALTSTSALYAPTIANTQIVGLPALVSTPILQVPVLTITGGSRTLDLSLLDSEAFLYPPTLTTGTIYVPGPGAAPPSIVIRVHGVDVTDIVRYADAVFISQVNGTAGLCQFAVRDLGHDQSFVFGQSVTLEIGGILRWSGYLQTISRQYSAAVVDTTDPTETARWFYLSGSDVNILFSRRVTHDPAHPTRLTALAPPVAYRDAVHADQWKEDTPSDAVVKYFISHYTDMVADGVSMGGVQNLGSPNPDWAAAYAAAQTAGDFMRSVNTLLGGIWYLEPDKTLVHRAIELATTPKYLSDKADGNPNRVGVRDYSFVSDATAMVNDAHVWGTAPGVSSIGHSESKDTASIALHGLWQGGEFNQSMYKQTSLDNRAEALVYGNDASRHGAKDDKILVQATVYEPVFFLGDVVTCYSHVYEDAAGQALPYENADVLTAILPIRRIAYTFPTPTDVRYDLLLTQELDEPWSIYEYKFPKLKIPKTSGVVPKLPRLPKLPPIDVPGGCECGITDTFTRNLAAGWGTSDSGALWNLGANNHTTSAFVDGSVGVHTIGPGGVGGANWAFRIEELRPGMPGAYPYDVVFSFKVDTIHSLTTYFPLWLSLASNLNTSVGPAYRGTNGLILEVYDNSGDDTVLYIGSDGASNGSYPGNKYDLSVDTWYTFRMRLSTNLVEFRIWPTASTEPTTFASQVTADTGPYIGGDAYISASTFNVATSGTINCYFDNLDVTGVDRCAASQFDDFNRTVASGWGTATPHTASVWSVYFSNNGTSSVSGGEGIQSMTNRDGSGFGAMRNWVHDNSGPWPKLPPALVVGGSGDTTGQEYVSGIPFTCTALVKPAPNRQTDAVGFVQETYLEISRGFVWGLSFNINTHNDLEFFIGDNSTNIDVTQLVVDYNAYYYMTIMVDETMMHGKAWRQGDAEPSGWLVECPWEINDSTTFGDFFRANVTGQLQLANGSTFTSTARWQFIDFDYEGRPCFPGDCSAAGDFDDFSRTVSGNRWGAVTPSGNYAWTNIGTPSATLSVNGTQGVCTFVGSGSVTSARQRIPSASGAPWNWVPGDIITVRTSFQISSIGSGAGDYGSIGWYFGDTGNSFAEVYCGPEISTSGNVYANAYGAGDGFLSKGTWTANVDYNAIIQYEPGVALRLKLWLASASEPGSWTVVASDTGNPSTPVGQRYFGIEQYGRTAKTIKTNYISFDGSGPCSDCDETVIDDFSNRTIAMTIPPSSSQGNFWGSTSAQGIVWRNSGRVGSPGLNVEWGVEPGVGRCRLTTSGVSVQAAASLNTGGSDVSPWSLVGNGFPTGLVTGSVIEFAMDLKCDTVEGYFELSLADNIATDVGGVVIYLDWDNITGGFGLDTFHATGTFGAFIPAINTWYTLKTRITNGAATLKLWPTGTAEPGWLLTNTESGKPPWTPGELTFWVHGAVSAPGGVSNYWFANFRMVGDCSDVPGPAEEVVGVPLYGEVWETLTHGAGTTFHTTRAFTSISVWVNGGLVSVNTSTGSTGTFTLSSAIAASDTLRVRYQANGDPI